MNKINVKQYRYIAGGLFAAELVLTLISGITGSFSFWTVLSLAASALMAAAMFAEKYVLLAAGAGLKLPSGLYSVATDLQGVFDAISYGNFRNLPRILAFALGSILFLAGCVLLLIAVFKRANAKKLCLASAGLRAGVLLTTFAGNIIWRANIGLSIRLAIQYSFQNSFRLILTTLLACGSIVLAGLVMQTQKQPAVARAAAPAAAPVAVDATARIDKLMKLKALLDSGVLTQEEFDAKKQELLNM